MNIEAIIRDIELSKITGSSMCPEADKAYTFLRDIIDSCEYREYENGIMLVKNGTVCLKTDKRINTTWLDYNDVWTFFKKEYDCETNEISQLTTYILKNY